MDLVQSLPAGADLFGIEADRLAGLAGSRCAAQLDEEPVGAVAELEVGGVDTSSLPDGATRNSAEAASLRPRRFRR